MSSLAAKLLAAAGRPDAESDRIIAAVNTAAGTGADLADALDRANAEIADEKRPRRAPALPEHLEQFAGDGDGDGDGGGFDDLDPDTVVGVNPRYLIDDDEPEPAPEPQPEPQPEPPQRRARWEDQATAPPQYLPPPPPVFDEPDPQPSETLASRLGRALSASGVARRFGGPRRKLKLAGAAAAALLLAAAIVASFVVTGRGEPPRPADRVADAPGQTDAPPPAAPKDMILVPATVSASCGNDTDAVAPFSGDPTRAWLCRRLNGLDLNVLNMTFSCPVVVNAITVVPGFAYVAPDGRDEWVRHRLTAAVSFRMGGAIYEMRMTPTRTGITQRFPDVITEVMSMTITATVRPPVESKGTDTFGSKADDIAKVDEFSAISKIVIHGHPVDPGSGLCGSTPTGGTAQ